MDAIENYDQATVDRLCRAIAWATYNEPTAVRLANMSVDESGMGGREPRRRAKIMGVLRDALRQKSMGVIEEIPEKGIVKYAKPAGVIAALIPVTSAYVTPATVAVYAIKCKDAVIFSPHPASKKTTAEVVRIMRAALKKAGAPEDILQCADFPDSIGVNGWPVEAHVSGNVLLKFPPIPESRGFNQLPYRMIVPKTIDNLFMAGRCASMTHDGQSSARVSGPCFAMGQAAGTAADLALKDKVAPRAVNVKTLQQRLQAAGVYLGMDMVARQTA